MNNPYRLAANTFDEKEINAAKEVLDSGNLTMGQRVSSFENEFALWTGAKYAVMVNSGSSANLLAVDAMIRSSTRPSCWQPGDEVLVPALSWPTTVWPLVQLGLVPVFVDVDETTLAISLESAASALSSKTKGMFLIHVLGQTPDMGEYQRFCVTNGLVLLEDTCESLGSHFNGVHAGNFGEIGTFSFYFSHHISTIEGGAIITNSQELRDDLMSLRAHGWIRDRSDKSMWKEKYPSLDERFMFVTSGYNVRPTEIQGAIGSVQLTKLDSFLESRERLARNIHGWLTKHAPWLALVGASRIPEEEVVFERRKCTHSWMVFPLLLEKDAPVNARELMRLFEERGVETRPLLAGNLARHPTSERFNIRIAGTLTKCDHLLERGLMLGCHPVPDEAALQTLEKAINSLGAL